MIIDGVKARIVRRLHRRDSLLHRPRDRNPPRGEISCIGYILVWVGIYISSGLRPKDKECTRMRPRLRQRDEDEQACLRLSLRRPQFGGCETCCNTPRVSVLAAMSLLHSCVRS
ncbi:unnamed protein product [Ascophyllum nodosum]